MQQLLPGFYTSIHNPTWQPYASTFLVCWPPKYDPGCWLPLPNSFLHFGFNGAHTASWTTLGRGVKLLGSLGLSLYSTHTWISYSYHSADIVRGFIWLHRSFLCASSALLKLFWAIFIGLCHAVLFTQDFMYLSFFWRLGFRPTLTRAGCGRPLGGI